MSSAKTPRSLRSLTANNLVAEVVQGSPTRKVTVGCLVAVASITGAKAQTPLAPVTVEAPVTRKKPAATKPTAEQLRVRAALRRAVREKQAAQAKLAQAQPNSFDHPDDRDPYADPAAPYKADRLASPKFTQPIINTPRTITVLTQQLLEDKQATSLKEVGRTTAGVTLGAGEGGNAFGDRFFIRGFDARNDVFVDGIRDPAVNIRENFFTEQVEILKGPSATIDGRGTSGGAINIVTKQAGDNNFYDSEATLASDNTKRVTFDVNQVINPTLSVRIDGMAHDADVSERNYTTDKRDGLGAAVKWAPTSDLKVTANFLHTYLWGLPDFGVPYNNLLGAPVTSVGVPRDTYYGFVNRDFTVAQQDLATQNIEYHLGDAVTLNNKVREERSVLNYIGTIPEQAVAPKGCGGVPGAYSNLSGPISTWTTCLNPQSRYQVTDVFADEFTATTKFFSGPVEHTVVTGALISREEVNLNSYTGLTSEAIGGGSPTGSVLAPILTPPNLAVFTSTPTLSSTPTVIPVDTKSLYALETADYQNYLIFTAGLRFDQTDVSATKEGVPAPNTVSASSGTWNYNLGLVYKPIPITSLYAAYGTGSEPVGSELDGTSANYGGLNPTLAVNQIFVPVESKAAEVGNKWELFDKHLLVTGALFRTDVSNARESVTNAATGIATITAGAAYHVQGIDLGVTGNINPRWSIYGGLVLMKTRVDQSIVPTNVGLPLAFIANQSFNMLTKYKLTDEIEVGGQATYRSKMYGGTLLAANAGTVLPSYWRFDSFVTGKLDKNWKWKVFANNIFDKLYYDAFYQSGTPFVLVAPGRVVGIELAAKY